MSPPRGSGRAWGCRAPAPRRCSNSSRRPQRYFLRDHEPLGRAHRSPGTPMSPRGGEWGGTHLGRSIPPFFPPSQHRLLTIIFFFCPQPRNLNKHIKSITPQRLLRSTDAHAQVQQNSSSSSALLPLPVLRTGGGPVPLVCVCVCPRFAPPPAGEPPALPRDSPAPLRRGRGTRGRAAPAPPPRGGAGLPPAPGRDRRAAPQHRGHPYRDPSSRRDPTSPDIPSLGTPTPGQPSPHQFPLVYQFHLRFTFAKCFCYFTFCHQTHIVLFKQHRNVYTELSMGKNQLPAPNVLPGAGLVCY